MPPSTLDTETLFLLQGILHVLVPLTVWSVLAGRHDTKTVALWCLSGLLNGAGFLLISRRGTVADWLSYPVATLFVYATYLLRAGVLLTELQRPPRWWLLLALAVLAAAGFEGCRALGRDEQEFYGAAVRVVAALWLAALGFALARRERNRSALLLGGVYTLAVVISLTRVAVVVKHWGLGLQPTISDYALVNASALLVALYANVGYVGLVLERYRARERDQIVGLHLAQERRQTAEQHAQALEVLRAERRDTLNEAVPAMMHSIDAQGRLLAVSDTWLSKLGYTRAEVINQPSIDFLTPLSREHARRDVLPDFFRLGRCDNVSYQMVCKHGGVLDVLLSAVLVRDDQGQPMRSLAVIEDVTEKLAREAELAREHALRAQVERHAEELHALVEERTEMLHVLAHEVRQPLHNASAALLSAQQDLQGLAQVPATERLHSAQIVIGEVLSGLDNTLAVAALLAGPGRVATQDADIDTLLAITIGDIPAAVRARVRVERMTSTRTAAMDTSLVRLALRNLLDNALSYSPPEAPVRLRVSDSDQPLALVLEVIDEGPGIETSLRDRLFQRGQRGAQGVGQPGSGLGLYIVRRVAELHGGHIEALSPAEGGTRMRLWLPQGVDE
ncbi:ATP-binding protein [Roseateles saccharophilus]|uniref:histidine kinase n=1 Tax=Roseateles saccharophilus TaxID=304 RepID=A0A4R3UPC5_ROSSA|nr:ATP-binding protein [Roseateles saccharophilus]MDG0833534.1 PAS domain S-box protein [Roseateles saccharophilus]TCU92557.1 PAS domain S-box-containing protein [Roseateles saccharophilus]